MPTRSPALPSPKASIDSPTPGAKSQSRSHTGDFDALRRAFLGDLASQVELGARSGNTLWTYEKRLEFFQRQMGVRDLAEVTPTFLNNFLLGLKRGDLPDSRKPASDSYLANHWRHLLGFLRWCRRRGYAVDPDLFRADDFSGRMRFALVEPVINQEDIEPRPWSPDELEDILAAARLSGPRDQLLVELLRSTGVRLSEASRIRLDDVQGENIKIGRSKSVRGRRLRVTRWVPNYPRLRRMIEVWEQRYRPACQHEFLLCQLDGGELTPRGIDSALDRIHARAGVSRGGAHRYRDTFATEFLRKNPGQVKKLKDILGHADYRTLEKYAKFRPEDLARSDEDPFA